MNKFYYLIIFNSFLSVFAQILLKKGALNNYDCFIRQYINIYVISGYVIYFVVIFINVYALKFLKISIVSSISESLPMLLSLIFGHLIFSERIKKNKIFGMLIILIGILVLTIQ